MQQMQQMMQAQQPRCKYTTSVFLTLLCIAPGVSSTITPEAITKLLGEMGEEEKKAIIEHLPDGQQTEEHLRANLLSPQLR